MKEQLKKVIKKNRSIYLKLKRMKNVIREMRSIPMIKKKDRPFVHSYNVQEIFMQQNRIDGYNRLDMIVRLLAIENEYGMNDIGWRLYARMQDIRVADEEPTTEERIGWFKDLIQSWDTDGYDEDSKIILDRNLMLVDGSHRLAMALFHGLKKINCQVLPIETDIVYNDKWFVENGFDLQDVKLIKRRADKLIMDNMIMISCILWPPVKKYHDEITEKLSYLYSVVETKDTEYKGECFDRFVQGVYSIDDIEQWKVDAKKKHMSNVEKKVVRYIKLAFDRPVYRIKEESKKPLLTQGEELKKIIRNCYSKRIPDYFYDIICHTGDNLDQSEYISRLCTSILTEI